MATLYVIRNWVAHFEKAQSRNVKWVSWVALPNKHDGKGFRRIMRRKDGVSVYGCWVLIVQVASKCPARGTLIDADSALIDAEAISDKTGAPQKAIENALEVLCSPEVGWLEAHEVEVDEHNRLTKALIARYEQLSSCSQILSLQDRTGQDPVGRLVGSRKGIKNGKSPTNGQVRFRCLSAVETQHLSSVHALCSIHRALHSEHPESIPADEASLLRVIGAAERALRGGGIKWFVGIVRKRKWENINGDEAAAARKKLQEHRSWIEAERKAGREVNEREIPLPDSQPASLPAT